MAKQTRQLENECPKCGYSLTGIAGDTCPECGLANVVDAAKAKAARCRIRYRRWLHGFAVALVCTTFLLVSWGGAVTSQDAGLAVPDAPESLGRNMFMLPPSEWATSLNGVFWEHSHRLLGSFVGMLSIVMCWSLILTQRGRNWLRWVGVLLLACVIMQGLMGIWRVTQINEYWAIGHGVFGQMVLCLTVLVAAATSRLWIERPAASRESAKPRPVKSVMRWSTALLVIVFIQLTLGATIRHTRAALAIPDFPTSYGGVVPPFTQKGIDEAADAYIAEHGYDIPFAALDEVTSTMIQHNFSHRVWAVVVCVVAIIFARKLARVAAGQRKLVFPILSLLLLLVVQVALGASVIWTGEQIWFVPTLHQMVGAAIIALSTLLAIRVRIVPLDWTTAPRIAAAGQTDRDSASDLPLEGAAV